MRTKTGRIIWMCLAAAAATGCRRGEEVTAKAPTPVKVRVVAEPAERGAARYSGTIEPAAKVDLAFKVGGYVREVAEARGKGRKLQEGDWVTKGTVLAIINDADYRQKISAARASLSEAIASATQARQDYDRAKALFETRAIAQAELDSASAKRDVGVARSDSARAQLSQAELSLADCTLRAPFDGVVIRRTIEVGTLASPGTLAYTIADTRTAKVVFGAPDALLDRLHIGDKLGVRVDALRKDLTGGITRIAPSADAKSRTFDVEASLDNQDDLLKVGMVVSIQIPDQALASAALALPLTAVVRAPKDPRGFAVYVVDKSADADVAHIRDVKLGDIVGSAVMVVAGVQPGERVIEKGTTFVTDGERVRVVR
jgi:multidrug efflux system membrane fusion protein